MNEITNAKCTNTQCRDSRIKKKVISFAKSRNIELTSDSGDHDYLIVTNNFKILKHYSNAIIDFIQMFKGKKKNMENHTRNCWSTQRFE